MPSGLELLSLSYEDILEHCSKTKNLADIAPMLVRLCEFVDTIPDDQLISGIRSVIEKRTKLFESTK